jgi:hypothetical protein
MLAHMCQLPCLISRVAQPTAECAPCVSILLRAERLWSTVPPHLHAPLVRGRAAGGRERALVTSLAAFCCSAVSELRSAPALAATNCSTRRLFTCNRLQRAFHSPAELEPSRRPDASAVVRSAPRTAPRRKWAFQSGAQLYAPSVLSSSPPQQRLTPAAAPQPHYHQAARHVLSAVCALAVTAPAPGA